MSDAVIRSEPGHRPPRRSLAGGRLATVTPLRERDPEMELVAANIGHHGLHVVHVGERCDRGGCAASPPPPDERFGYTVGHTAHGHPELLVRGLDGRDSAEVLDTWGAAVLSGDTLAEGHMLCEGPGARRWVLVPVLRSHEVLLWATRFYGRAGLSPLPALELVPTRRPCGCADCG